MQAVDKVKIDEFPWLVKSEIVWAKISQKKLVSAQRPAGMHKPSMAELVINTIDGENFTAVKYGLDGSIYQTTGDGLQDRINTALNQPLWMWYYKSEPTEQGVIVHVLLYARIRCGECQKLIAPHSCMVKEPGLSDVTPTDFIGSFAHECAACK